MSILARLALLFVLVPLLELTLLIQVGRWVGLWPTVGMVFLTGIVGAGLARMEGLRTLWAFRADLGRGRIPAQPIQDGLAILVGGALLLTPGFLTDVFGFALLLPPSRRAVQRAVRRRLRAGIESGTIRVVTSSPTFGGGGRPGDASGRGGGDGDPGSDPSDRDLDPDKEIVV
ncbi:MAG: FxsA family protein [Gemmatimonadetes bacterium]|nr:FxsA family protein [Gemmatimonadota bacterium]NIR77331.1 FxsA family protein [Gemmatimonadota bacterium]NIT85857.1 FxsA family protein [Gemmatimonadota bacterium]NIU29679.1 FxsA family protein [Gemmatimonadota bacterium]NIU34723.1 FxsA family protein [Gemmatimonadota bacterium]